MDTLRVGLGEADMTDTQVVLVAAAGLAASMVILCLGVRWLFAGTGA